MNPESGNIHTAEDHVDTDGIFVNVFHGFLRVKSILALDGNWDKASLYVEVASEFLEGHLGISAHDYVGTRLVDGFASGFAFLLPDALHSQATKLDRL
jgi:hypothetical protein